MCCSVALKHVKHAATTAMSPTLLACHSHFSCRVELWPGQEAGETALTCTAGGTRMLAAPDWASPACH
jgi:hypothetical protein